MAKKPKKDGAAEAAPKTVENISDDQLQALFFQGKRDYERALAAKKKSDADFKNCCKRIRAEIGKRGVDEIKLAILLGDENGEAEAKADIESALRVMRWLNVAMGFQGSLFDEPDRRPIGERSYAEGRRQGLAGEKQDNPHHQTTEAYREHIRGYADGQEALATKGFTKKDDGLGTEASTFEVQH